MTAHAIARTNAMPNLPIFEMPDPAHWVTPGITAAGGVIGTWLVHWLRNRGQAQRRMDDRFNEWTAKRDAELAELHKEMRDEVSELRLQVDEQGKTITRLTTFSATLYLLSTQLARAVVDGSEARHLAEMILGMKPPEALHEAEK